MKWMIEEARLGEDQREIIDEVSKSSGQPIWIQGHAGSGKSVVLLHALSDHLIRNPKANVVVVVFTRALVDLIRTGIKQIPALQNRHVPVYTIDRFNRILGPADKYDAIFCDEVQDLPIGIIQRMREAAETLIIAGDASQSIFGSVPWLGGKTASSEEISNTISPINKKSSTIYRLTQSVIAVLKNVYSDLLNDRTYVGKEDSQIRLYKSNSSNYMEESVFSWEECDMINRTRPDEVTAILLFKKEDIIFYCQQVLKHLGKQAWSGKKVTNYEKEEYDLNDLNNHLSRNDVPLMYVGSGAGSLEQADRENKIIIMTYHSAKGLDFDAVCLPYLSVSLGATTNENALMLVALSRAKRDLLITYTGEMYHGFNRFLKDLTSAMIGTEENEDEILF